MLWLDLETSGNGLLSCLNLRVQALGLRSFRAAGVALVGLLLYDVFWVFGSPKVCFETTTLYHLKLVK